MYSSLMYLDSLASEISDFWGLSPTLCLRSWLLGAKGLLLTLSVPWAFSLPLPSAGLCVLGS